MMNEPIYDDESSAVRFFRREDWIAAIATFIFSTLVFFHHMAPEVTLQDSGELVTGAFTFGVPHPPGYPLWALFGYVWSNFIVPFGNPAWRIGTMSVVTGGLTVGVMTLMMTRSTRILLHTLPWGKDLDGRFTHWISLATGMSSALLFGFNRGVWLWASVSEMRVLNAFSFILIACLFFGWMMRPNRLGYLCATLLVYGFSMTNHQTVAVMALAVAAGALAVGVDGFFTKYEASLGKNEEERSIFSTLMPSLSVFWEILIAVLFSLAAVFVLFGWLKTSLPHGAVFQEAKEKAIFFWGAVAFVLGMLMLCAGWFMRRFAPQHAKLCAPLFWIGAVFCFVAAYLFVAGLRLPPLTPGGGVVKTSDGTPFEMPSEFRRVLVMLALGALMLGVGTFMKWLKPHRAMLYTLLFMVGCAMYFYMPLAASTNPPMNWGFASTKEGFLHAITRGQYKAVEMADPCGALFGLKLWIFTRGLLTQFSWPLCLFALVSLVMPTVWLARELMADARKYIWLLLVWLAAVPASIAGVMMMRHMFLDSQAFHIVQNYRPWLYLAWGIALPTLLVMLLGLWLYLRRPGRSWMMFVWAAFLACSLGLIIIINPEVTRQEQEITIKFFAPAHGFFAMLIGYGIAITLAAIGRFWKHVTREIMAVLCAACMALPLVTYLHNWNLCALEKFDFGYQFGYRMFNPGGGYPEMTRDAVLFGGTDPGRFVPTYMIFCQSFVRPECRFVSPWMSPDITGEERVALEQSMRDFDRRDVYIITQNALADQTYMNYIRDHYDYTRPTLSQLAAIEALEEAKAALEKAALKKQNKKLKEEEKAVLEKEIKTLEDNVAKLRVAFVETVKMPGDNAEKLAAKHVNGTLPATTLERWIPGQRWVFKHAWTLLGRNVTYPEQPIRIPTPEDSSKAFEIYVKDVQEGRRPNTGGIIMSGGRIQITGALEVMEINGILTKWIHDWNKDKHDFYIEESYPISWMNPYLRPFGVIMKIEKEPLPSPQQNPALWAEIVATDKAYWDTLTAELLARKEFKRSDDAQKNFSKLRSAIAGIYLFRGMGDEAEHALKQAVALCPKGSEGGYRLAELYLAQRHYDKARALMENNLVHDPYNKSVRRMLDRIDDLIALEQRRENLLKKLEGEHTINDIFDLIVANIRLGRQGEAVQLSNSLLANPNAPAQTALQLGLLLAQLQQPGLARQCVQHYTTRQPSDPRGWIELGWLAIQQRQAQEGFDAWKKAVDLGRETAREFLRTDERFRDFWKDLPPNSAFNNLIKAPVPQRPQNTLPVPQRLPHNVLPAP